MRRTAGLLVAFLMWSVAAMAGGAGVVLAQTGPAVGTEVPVVDADGVTHGTIQIEELNDPFQGDPDSPPADGSRYVGLIAVFTAADDQQLDANPYYVVVRDTDGYLYTPQYVARPADDPIPDLQSQTLAPGNRISGFVGYVLPSSAAIDDVFYTPSSYEALTLVQVDQGLTRRWTSQSRSRRRTAARRPSRSTSPTRSRVPPRRPRRACATSGCRYASRTPGTACSTPTPATSTCARTPAPSSTRRASRAPTRPSPTSRTSPSHPATGSPASSGMRFRPMRPS
ncbi:MAG: hypothetical protein R3C32_07735 [Chloroflexota bacterium]